MLTQPNVLFKMAREAQAVKQIDAAAAANISHVALSRFESGKSTLSLNTMLKIAPLLNVNPLYLRGESVNPFRAKKLIKMSLPETLSGPNFDLIYLLAEGNQQLDFIYLQLPPFWRNKLARHSDAGEPYIVALAIQDADLNYFIFRRKLRRTIDKISDTTGLQEMQKRLDLTGLIVFDKAPSFSVTSRILTEELLKKIQSWTVERADIESLFRELQKDSLATAKKGMPAPFLEQLKKDLGGQDLDRKFYKKAGIDKATLQATLAGKGILSRQKVIALALALGRSPDYYLLPADYMPDSLKVLGEYPLKKIHFSFAPGVSGLTPAQWDVMIDHIEEVVKQYIKVEDKSGGP